ncbi:tryptophan synthase subunit alpha [Paenibacillus radicis (ex Xue et al. 2023)]|uniref:Tryptophan synthase alpha chain n=1 Tax=Paenibacillus radicis (ex Xue et al. 2023) TaxID=2972489 RepID=A0ABT1YCP2_9BACL|nr:tryptophan synthase subunit alpha [Paenibacillus radicis (ex Xue et al. 2023)]MCR8630964.1 tryptophan synthase subunit alpha [Paenibacillus radicis (ex Xue et al. 2023)]
MKNGKHLSNKKTSNTTIKLAEQIKGNKAASGKSIQLMTHQILGYPDFDTNYEMIQLFHENSVDLVELQLPFSEPIADGPVFLRANQTSLANGTTTRQCMDFARRAVTNFPNISFIFMTYYNIVIQYGIEPFIRECADIGIRGLIVPDALPEESCDFMNACREYGVEPILIATPYTTDLRLAYLSEQTGGFLYCAPRKGVTGSRTAFGDETDDFLSRVRGFAKTPIAVGFGIQTGEDVAFLQGKCDIAIIGTQLLNILEKDGLTGVERFLKSVNSNTR